MEQLDNKLDFSFFEGYHILDKILSDFQYVWKHFATPQTPSQTSCNEYCILTNMILKKGIECKDSELHNYKYIINERQIKLSYG